MILTQICQTDQLIVGRVKSAFSQGEFFLQFLLPQCRTVYGTLVGRGQDMTFGKIAKQVFHGCDVL